MQRALGLAIFTCADEKFLHALLYVLPSVSREAMALRPGITSGVPLSVKRPRQLRASDSAGLVESVTVCEATYSRHLHLDGEAVRYCAKTTAKRTEKSASPQRSLAVIGTAWDARNVR